MKFHKIIFVFVLSQFFLANFCLASIPSDPYFNKQWYLEKLNFSQIWEDTTGSPQIIIAVIDSGIDTDHPDLHDNIWVNQNEILGDGIDNDKNGYIDDIAGWDFVLKNNDPSPKYDADCLQKESCISEAVIHGTLISGVAAAIGNNNVGVTGISWRTKIMALRVLDQNGNGNTSDIVEAIYYAINNGADIINLSFIGDTSWTLLQQVIQIAWDKGILIVAAAGNENFAGETTDLDLHKMYPVCYQGANNENIVIGVGATDENKKIADFSNYGSSCVDVMAPGDNFFGTILMDKRILQLKDYYGGDFSGTSVAAPVVSGLAALIWSYRPDLSNTQVRDLILNYTENINIGNPDYNNEMGRGLIDPLKIFQALKTIFISQPLVKASDTSVYYLGVDKKRYIFTDEKNFTSWFSDFSKVKKISAEQLAAIPLAGLVTYKPGTLIKLQTLPTVYAVSQGAILRPIANEETAAALYSADWTRKVIDVSDTFFTSYTIGEPISNNNDYDPLREHNMAVSIDLEKGLIL